MKLPLGSLVMTEDQQGLGVGRNAFCGWTNKRPRPSTVLAQRTSASCPTLFPALHEGGERKQLKKPREPIKRRSWSTTSLWNNKKRTVSNEGNDNKGRWGIGVEVEEKESQMSSAQVCWQTQGERKMKFPFLAPGVYICTLVVPWFRSQRWT